MLGPGDEYSLGCIDTEEYSWKKTGKLGENHLEVLCKDRCKVARVDFKHFESGSHYMMIYAYIWVSFCGAGKMAV